MAKKQVEKKTVANLDELKATIEEQYGDGALMIGRNSIIPVDVFPTMVASIDKALGVGGIPQGRIIEIYGSEGSGKTTTCLQFISACQKYYFHKKERYGTAAFIDAEHAFDPSWAEKIGVDMNKLLMSQPDSGEEAFQIVERLIRSNLVDLIVVDSVAALSPKEELEGEIGDNRIGAQARMMSQGLRILKGAISRSKCAVVFINQVREKIGVMFGNPESTPGGRALKFYSSIRGEISRGGRIVDGDVVIGFTPKIKFIKNKVAPPFTFAEYEICFGNPSRPVCGIDINASIMDVAIADGFCSKKGNFYNYGDITLGNGRINAVGYLRNNPEFADELRSKIYDKLFNKVEVDKTLNVDISV